jgi:hypothetical protein
MNDFLRFALARPQDSLASFINAETTTLGRPRSSIRDLRIDRKFLYHSRVKAASSSYLLSNATGRAISMTTLSESSRTY